jgi:hypothetical protein
MVAMLSKSNYGLETSSPANSSMFFSAWKRILELYVYLAAFEALQATVGASPAVKAAAPK